MICERESCVHVLLHKPWYLGRAKMESHLAKTLSRGPLHKYLLTHALTPHSTVLLEKLTCLQLLKKFPAFYWTRRFITAFTSARHLSLSWTSPIQSIPPHLTSWRSILILSSHLRLGLPSGLFPTGFPTQTLYTPLPSPIRATCPAHLILFDLITRTILSEEYRSSSSLLWWMYKYLGHINNVQTKSMSPNFALKTAVYMTWRHAKPYTADVSE
jgi:hypothetical protein